MEESEILSKSATVDLQALFSNREVSGLLDGLLHLVSVHFASCMSAGVMLGGIILH